MKTRYHIELTRRALGEYFGEVPLNIITHANIKQDKISNQFGHDYIHFDGSAFKQGFQFINDQKDIVVESVNDEKYIQAQKGLGRLLHTWQDFYSHSNYVKLWLNNNPNAKSGDIPHNDQRIFQDPDLSSGKNYGIIEFIAMIPFISQLITPLMPEDSHAKMNIDSPKSSNTFPFAYEAALRCSKAVYFDIMKQLQATKVNNDKLDNFLGKSIE